MDRLKFLLWKISGAKERPINTIIYVSEDSEWVIKRIGEKIVKNIKKNGFCAKIAISPLFHCNSIIHFGSVHTFLQSNLSRINKSNRLVATIFHGNFGINEEMDAGINKIIKYNKDLSRIIVANSLMKKRLIGWGVPEAKIRLVPIGVDLGYFKPDKARGRQLRNDLGIPEDAVCIGSFQKDGIGWKEGLEPKLTKGPDVFVEAVTMLSRRCKVHCLLLGPARGFVKKALQKKGIPYTHHFLRNYFDVAQFYNCLDLYLVASREEGGPEAILESMASGVPVVSTEVGMAADIIKDGENGLLTMVEDAAGLAGKAKTLIEDEDLRVKLIRSGLESVKQYDWGIVSGEYARVYQEIIR